MATVSVAQTSFTGGEWAPALFARTKLVKYYTAVRTMLNFIIHPHGPTSNRPGTRFVAVSKQPGFISRLIPFTFSVVQAYMLEFGHLTLRIFKDGAPVVEAGKAITGATQADPVVITAVGHGFANGDTVILSGLGGMIELNGRAVLVTNKTTNTFQVRDTINLDIDGTGFTAYTTGGAASRVYEISTPYDNTHLSLLKFEQSADVLYISHPAYAERQLTRTGHTSWTIGLTTIGAGISVPTSFIRVTGSATDHVYAVTAVAADGSESVISNSASGGPTDIFSWTAPSTGTAVHYNFYEEVNGVYGWLGFVATNSNYVVPDPLAPDMQASPPKAGNIFTGADNFPGVLAFHEQRMVRARTTLLPQTLVGSVTGDFDNTNFSTPQRDDDSYTFTISSNQVNEIRWMVSLRDLIIGTAGSIWRMASGSGGDAITFNSVDMKRQSAIGVSDVHPIVVDNSILYIEAAGAKVRDLFYSFEADGYRGNDLSILASHLFQDATMIDWTYQRHPNSIIWGVMSDGSLAGLTYYREHEVWGWHRHETNGTFDAVASVTNSSGTNDVYFIVRRVINGFVWRFVEILSERLPNEDVKDAFFVDSGLSLDVPVTITAATVANPVVISATGHGFLDDDIVDIEGVEGMTEINDTRFIVDNAVANSFSLKTPEGADVDGSAYTAYVSGGNVRKAVTTINGLSHLEGEAVSVLADGSVIPSKTVVSGAITLDTAASRVHVGLGYTCDLETMDFEFPAEDGNTVQDKRRDINSVVLRLENTRALSIGPSEDALEVVPFRQIENYDDPTALFTGDKEIEMRPGDVREDRVFIRTTDPLPVTITTIIARVERGDS